MISLISDIHIKKPGDEACKLFLSFLDHADVKQSDSVALLGDIFDLLVGGDQPFVKEFEEVFKRINGLLEAGKKVYYLEGNHDFHIDKLFKKVFTSENFIFSKKMMKIQDEGIDILICHGDDIELDNTAYKRYSAIIKSLPIRILAEDVVPFSFTRKVGEWASQRSRKKNIEAYQSKTEEIRDKFRRSADEAFKKTKTELLIAGHSHVKDTYESSLGFTYLNNGYVPEEKTFLKVNGKKYSFVNLVDSSH